LAKKKLVRRAAGKGTRASLKRRTRAHIIASLSANAIERAFLANGHTVLKNDQDYVVDLVVFTYDENGYVESGNIYIQLKASDRPKLSADGTFYTFSISIKDYNAWSIEPMPVFLILYNSKKEQGYWQYVQGYFESDADLRPSQGADTVTVRLPVVNVFDETTVKYIRTKKAAVLGQLKGAIRHDL